MIQLTAIISLANLLLADMYEKMIGWCLERLQQHGNAVQCNKQRPLVILSLAVVEYFIMFTIRCYSDC